MKKAETSDGLWYGMEVCYPTCSEGFRYLVREDQHQGSERGSGRMVCRWEEMEDCLVNGGEGLA